MNIKLSSGFTFNFTNIKDQEITHSKIGEPKKKSPSTLRRDAIRKQKFLEQKKEISATPKPPDHSFQCELCVFVASCEVNLRKHIQKEHNVIPQLGGLEEPFDDILSKYEEKKKNDILDTKSVDDAKKIKI